MMFKLGAILGLQSRGCSGLEVHQGTSLLLLGEPAKIGNLSQFILQTPDNCLRLLLQSILLICEGRALVTDSPYFSGMPLLLLGEHFPRLRHVLL